MGPKLKMAVFLLATCLLGLALGMAAPNPDAAGIDQALQDCTCDRIVQWTVYDADTLKNCKIYCGHRSTIDAPYIRIAGYDAWEVSRRRRTVNVTDAEIERGKQATSEFAAMLDQAAAVLLTEPPKRDPYGRNGGYLRLLQPDGTIILLESYAIAHGWDRTVDEQDKPRSNVRQTSLRVAVMDAAFQIGDVVAWRSGGALLVGVVSGVRSFGGGTWYDVVAASGRRLCLPAGMLVAPIGHVCSSAPTLAWSTVSLPPPPTPS